MRTLFITTLLLAGSLTVLAQGPRGGRLDPSKMLQMEKGAILNQVTDLSEAQKQELTALYDDLALEVDQKMVDARETRKEERDAFQAKKTEALTAIFSDEQLKQYQDMVAEFRKKRGMRPHKGRN